MPAQRNRAEAVNRRPGEITPQLSRTGIRQLRKMLDDLRRVSAIRFPRAAVRDPGGVGRRVAYQGGMELAYQLGASVVVNHLGLIPSNTDSDAWRMLISAQDLGMVIGAGCWPLRPAESGPSWPAT